MTYFLGYTPRGTEFAVEEAINALGGFAVVPRKVELEPIKNGSRKMKAVESPVLNNYVFARLTDQEWHLVRNSLRGQDGKRLPFSTVGYISEIEWRMNVQPFTARVEQDYQFAMAEIEAGRRRTRAQRIAAAELAKFKIGEALLLLGGMFEGKMATLKAIVEMDGKPAVQYEVQAATMLGQPIIGEIDPVLVRKAAAE